jgi:opacity protein-like surface antigen
MRRIVAGFGLFGLLLVVPTRPVVAQMRGYFGAGAGIAIPTGDFADAVKTGWIGHVIGGFSGPKGMLGARVNGSFTQNNFDAGGGNFRLVGAMGDLVVSPMTGGGKARPYFLGGLGFQSGKNSISDSSSTKFAFNFGAGVTIKAGPNLAVFGEGRFVSVRFDPSASVIPISVGVRFGGM